MSVGEGVGLDVGAGVGAGDGDGLGDCVQTGVLHAACSVVKGHRAPVPSEIVVMVRWRLERPPPPANARWGRSRGALIRSKSVHSAVQLSHTVHADAERVLAFANLASSKT